MYKVISKEIFVEGERHISYGIACDSTEVSDLSTDKERVERFAEMCNRLELSEVHLFDAAEDFVSGDIDK